MKKYAQITQDNDRAGSMEKGYSPNKGPRGDKEGQGRKRAEE